MKYKYTESIGGYLVPETWVSDVERPGLLFVFIRWVGERLLRIGAGLRSFGYSKKEVSLDFRKMMEAAKITKR